MLTVATWIGALATSYAKKAFGEQAKSVTKQSEQLGLQVSS